MRKRKSTRSVAKAVAVALAAAACAVPAAAENAEEAPFGAEAYCEAQDVDQETATETSWDDEAAFDEAASAKGDARGAAENEAAEAPYAEEDEFVAAATEDERADAEDAEGREAERSETEASEGEGETVAPASRREADADDEIDEIDETEATGETTEGDDAEETDGVDAYETELFELPEEGAFVDPEAAGEVVEAAEAPVFSGAEEPAENEGAAVERLWLWDGDPEEYENDEFAVVEEDREGKIFTWCALKRWMPRSVTFTTDGSTAETVGWTYEGAELFDGLDMNSLGASVIRLAPIFEEGFAAPAEPYMLVVFDDDVYDDSGAKREWTVVRRDGWALIRNLRWSED